MHVPRRELLIARTPKCTCGCPELDALLRGGVPCGAITELCGEHSCSGAAHLLLHFLPASRVWLAAGEASAAKTQLCLQLLLCAQLPVDQGGLDGSALCDTRLLCV
jgi:DNA-repair protein XRCC3